jgi:hypothetical protein
MPIQLTKIGGWGPKDRPYGFKKDDIGIINNERGIAKIVQKWSKVKQNFNTYICRSSNCFKQIEIGEVDENFVRDQLKLKIVPNPTQPDEIFIDENSINYIVTNNRGDERMPLNSWTLAHRFGHVLARGNRSNEFRHFMKEFYDIISRILLDVYNIPVHVNQGIVTDYKQRNILSKLFTAIGTMGSARKNQLRQYFEFPYELIAQFIITGNISFNPLPQSIKYFKQNDNGRGEFNYLRVRDNDELQGWNDFMQDSFPDSLKYYIDFLLESCVGKIYVM